MSHDVGRPESQPEILEEDFGESFGGRPQDALRPVFFLDRGELLSGVVEGFVPRNLAPFAFAARSGANKRPL